MGAGDGSTESQEGTSRDEEGPALHHTSPYGCHHASSSQKTLVGLCFVLVFGLCFDPSEVRNEETELDRGNNWLRPSPPPNMRRTGPPPVSALCRDQLPGTMERHTAQIRKQETLKTSMRETPLANCVKMLNSDEHKV